MQKLPEVCDIKILVCTIFFQSIFKMICFLNPSFYTASYYLNTHTIVFLMAMSNMFNDVKYK